METLFESAAHKNIFYNDLTSGRMVEANQHVIIDGEEAIVLDPGGHKVHTKLFSQLSSVIPVNGIKYIFFSHQDPDIVAAANAWMMMTDARAYLSKLWIRFIPHFGVDEYVADRIDVLPDEGGSIKVGASELQIIPAHFLHSCGNFHLYDPTAKVLYTGDFGASFGEKRAFVEDFEGHIKHMEWFHRRYIPSSLVIKVWLKTVSSLDVETIAPQHGSILRGKEMVQKFYAWADTLECGIDLMKDGYKTV